MKRTPGEVIIVGKWLFNGGQMIADANCKRIGELTQGYFKKVKTSPDGWFTIYQDPEDLRYWELSYPRGEMQGGGPPMLYCVGTAIANKSDYNPFKKLTRQELISVVQRLMDVEGTFNDEMAQFRAIESNFRHANLVFSDIYQNVSDDGTAKRTAEEIVDKV